MSVRLQISDERVKFCNFEEKSDESLWIFKWGLYVSDVFLFVHIEVFEIKIFALFIFFKP